MTHRPDLLAQDNYHIKSDTDAFKKNVKSALEKRMNQGYYAQDKNSWYLTDAGDEFYRGQYETSSEQEDDEVRDAFLHDLLAYWRFPRGEGVSSDVADRLDDTTARAEACQEQEGVRVEEGERQGKVAGVAYEGWISLEMERFGWACFYPVCAINLSSFGGSAAAPREANRRDLRKLLKERGLQRTSER